MVTMKSYRSTVRPVRRPPVPKGKPARLSVEQARGRGRNVRKARSR